MLMLREGDNSKALRQANKLNQNLTNSVDRLHIKLKEVSSEAQKGRYRQTTESESDSVHKDEKFGSEHRAAQAHSPKPEKRQVQITPRKKSAALQRIASQIKQRSASRKQKNNY